MAVVLLGLVVLGSGLGSSARGQMWFPGGYGGYGYSKWGADPGAGYMAGLGSFARGQGAYAVDKAKADAINLQTMLKWNKALRASQARLKAEKTRAAVVDEVGRESRVAEVNALNGTTLNDLLLEILDSDPGAVSSSRVNTPLGAAAIRAIPFEWDSEAITICLDEMTGRDSLPRMLMDPQYDADRTALRSAVATALAEDVKGPVTEQALHTLKSAAAKLRADFQASTDGLEPGYTEARDYLSAVEGLSRVLGDPSMKAFLGKLADGEERTVGDLIAFMNAFNLRFGPATTAEQQDIYRRLLPAIAAVRDSARASRNGQAGVAQQVPDGTSLGAAATEAFKGMNWKDLDAHAQTSP
jgi:hypothetical protein